MLYDTTISGGTKKIKIETVFCEIFGEKVEGAVLMFSQFNLTPSFIDAVCISCSITNPHTTIRVYSVGHITHHNITHPSNYISNNNSFNGHLNSTTAMTAIHKTITRLSSSSSDPTQRSLLVPPNRMTSAFNRMREVCPDAIQLYATCVLNHQKLGSLEKDCCTAEFAAVKNCFLAVRRQR